MRFAVPPEIDASSFATWRQDAPVIEMGGETMGTTWRVKVAAPHGFDRAATLAAIEARLEGILAEMSHWRETSLLGRFNRAPAGSRIDLPPDFARVLECALDIARRSGGAFDPTIGALVDIWGFGPVKVARAPLASEIAQALSVSGFRHLDHRGSPAGIRQPGGLRLDFSGIAKGFAVDAIAELLRGHGCHHALVEIGGELVGLGLKPDGDPWWVGLETPAAGIPPLRVALHQLAVATSGDYVRGRHTIDPRTGKPVEHAASVSVIHSSAMLADAWATALGVHASAAAQALATQENLAARLIVREGQALREWLSPALRTMLDPET